MALSMARWQGKLAVVTGASSGIGAAIVEKLVNEGMNVVGIARRKELIEQHAAKLKGKTGKLYAVKADISIEAEIVSAFKWAVENVGPVHVLINNAGVMNINTTITDGDAAIWRNIFDVNVLGVCVSTREAVRDMKKNNVNGHIINISSVAAHGAPSGLLPTGNVYSASKHALKTVTDMVRLELQGSELKIKIGCVSPGFVDTDLVSDAKNKYNLGNMLKEAVTASDVGDAVIYSLSTPPNVQIQDIIIRQV